jgi:RNA polymerase sigma-70 factor, ECF subfamily
VPGSLDARATINAIWRVESPKVIAGLTRVVRDVGLAEELAQDALVAALEQWPAAGVPDNPGAWLMATARHHALNTLKRGKLAGRKYVELGVQLDAVAADADRIQNELAADMDDDVNDDLLRLVFIACHPVLPTEARVALTLRLLGGLTTDEIARAFLTAEPTIAQRIVRAKRMLAEKKIGFEVPRGDELGVRLVSVLEVVYLIFNEGYSAAAGDDWMRPALVEDALRLGRVLSALAPNEPEVLGLLALMELNASRAGARTDAAGDPILLLEQDRARWDQLLIQRGLAALARAEALTAIGVGGPSAGPYQLQAAIAACHARARAPGDTDWPRIADLYGALAARAPSPVVALNRAMAVAMSEGPAAALAMLDALASEPALASYPLLPSARADLLSKLGRREEARVEFERAAALTRNTRLRDRLLARAAACVTAPAPAGPRTTG